MSQQDECCQLINVPIQKQHVHAKIVDFKLCITSQRGIYNSRKSENGGFGFTMVTQAVTVLDVAAAAQI